MSRTLRSRLRAASLALWSGVALALAFVPTAELHVRLGVPLRELSGSFAATLLDVISGGGEFGDFVLRADALTPLLVVPECAGLGKFVLMIAFAIGLARRSGVSRIGSLRIVLVAAGLAIAANGTRLAAIARFVPTSADREGLGSLVHELCGLLPFAVGAGLLVGFVRVVTSRRSPAAPVRDVAFPAGIALLALAFLPLPGDGDPELRSVRSEFEDFGYETRIVDSWIDPVGRGAVGIEGSRSGIVRVRYERFETIDGSQSWPDLYAARFARLVGRVDAPIHRVVNGATVPASGL